ncbi:retroviral-like aspartic protease family protein [Alicyclobacillus suci]|uniref:retroviral-like aspartic protease family protein n=1 Tax=Alicyclobacillus suci TaxID=2816080 RepID=UPI001A8BF6D7|nr:retroviral-like aspartic protease family protein [Alicyclobacillus suci]
MPREIIARIRGDVTADAFYFPLRVNRFIVPDMVLDTGAYELTFSGAVAQALNLPHLGQQEITGVGGQSTAYRSQCDIYFDTRMYRNVPCVVDPALPSAGLFGLRFFVDTHLGIELHPAHQTMVIFSE